MSHILPVLLTFLTFITFLSPIHSQYHAHSFHQSPTGFQLSLDLIKPQSDISTPIPQLELKGEYWRDDVFRVSIRDRRKARWEVPHVLLPKPTDIQHNKDRQYTIDYKESPFALTVVRNADKVTIFNLTSLIYNDQYIEVQTSLNVEDVTKGPHIYGLGERVHNFRLDSMSKRYTLWAYDHGTPVDKPLYGSHPFHTQFYKGKFHGTFMLNSNAMDVVLDPTRLTYKMIGGIVDLFVFVGPTSEQVVQQYQQTVIGTPKMVPFWTLGNHQCRWGYKSIAELEGVINKYAALGIPVDTAWSDIDWMEEYKDFVPDSTNYNPKDVQAFVSRMKQQDRRYVVILDPGIKIEPGYKTYDEGLAQNVYVRSAVNGGAPLVGKVWPGYTTYPDWTAPNTFSWWKKQITEFISQYPVDGLWIDMNEAANFVDGECFMQSDLKTCYTRPAPERKPKGQFDPNYPPYLPGDSSLIEHTVSLDAVHNQSIEYNLHTLYGFMESMATQPALEAATGKRSFVLSRSTYPGSGRYAQHWLGDNNSDWDDLFYSISGLLNFQMYGIPFVGVDICGFGGNTNAELCARWVQLGSFYPFTRNHNAIDSSSQEYYVFGDRVVAVARSSLLTKYALLSYYYTLLHKSSQMGGTVLRPMLFEFPNDSDPNVPYLDRQFMVGSALMVLPVLEAGATSVTSYVPGVKGQDLWYDYSSGERVGCQGWCQFDAPLEKINVLMRGGHALLLHKVVDGVTTTTAQARRDGFRLLVALDAKKESQGDIFIDNGEDINVGENFIYARYQHRAASGKYAITSQAVHPGSVSNMNTQLKEIVVYGIEGRVTAVRVAGRSVSQFQFNTQTGVLTADVSLFGVDVQKIDIEYETA